VFNKHTAKEITAAAERFAHSLSITSENHDNKKSMQTVDPVRPYEAIEEGVAAKDPTIAGLCISMSSISHSFSLQIIFV
jgi:hypothetical protein